MPLSEESDHEEIPPTADTSISADSENITLYLGDSMFKHFNSQKLSSSSQRAIVINYPGASVGGVLTKLKTDSAFLNINPQNVQKIYLFCGANNVDKALNIPFSKNSDFIDVRHSRASTSAINSIKSEYLELTDFLHKWASSAKINILNILPRESLVRNNVINTLNQYINDLSFKYPFIEIVATENHRELFTFDNGCRKCDFFSKWVRQC